MVQSKFQFEICSHLQTFTTDPLNHQLINMTRNQVHDEPNDDDSERHQIKDDPFHLQSSGHPGLILVSHSLTERNYLKWSMVVTLSLGAKNKLGFIDGYIKQLDCG